MASLWTAMLVAQFALVPAQAADTKLDDIEGVITSRNGGNLVLRQTGLGVVNVTITNSTKIYELKGPLGIGILPSGMSPDVLVPGLKITVEPVSAAEKNVAKTIRFTTSDLETLYAIQAALAVPQAQIQALQQELAAQKQYNSIQDQAIAAGKDADAAVNKRISNLADYDQKAEINILFDVNSSTLSEKAKADLKAFAGKAKAFRGYLIQVAGYADAVGSAGRNQALSDRRAETVAAYLQQECDVALSRVLAPIAMGASNPVAPNETAQGRAENRRATVRIAVNRGIGE
ncbi:MAG TPA: OmpA family protein [Burkholderiales bacterium]|nr:OmpA family protein [Burkholderiales bacterium]